MATIIVHVGALIVAGYGNYLPPRFDAGFLADKRDAFFRTGYFIGFYAHIAAAPVALVCGLIQSSTWLRRRRPNVHRRIGRVYVHAVLWAMAPGGLVMSLHAYGGVSSIACFATLSMLTWGFTLAGWRSARRRRWREHGRWMIRSYVLVGSAILLRMIHFAIRSWSTEIAWVDGLPIHWSHENIYRVSAWLSWLPAWLITELWLGRHPVLPVNKPIAGG